MTIDTPPTLPLLEEMFSVMFHQDAEIWADSLEIGDVLRAAGTHYPRNYLLDRLTELNASLQSVPDGAFAARCSARNVSISLSICVRVGASDNQ